MAPIHQHQLAGIYEISDLATLQVVADPLRIQILAELRRQPQTVKALAARFDRTPTKLYYHINLLEDHRLIQVVGLRAGAGPPEKEYGVTAARLTVNRSLLTPDGPAADDALEAFLAMVLDETKSEIRRSVAAGLIDPSPNNDSTDGLRLGRIWLRLTPAEAEALDQRILALIGEYTALHTMDDDQPDLRHYEMLLSLFAMVEPTQSADQPPPLGG